MIGQKVDLEEFGPIHYEKVGSGPDVLLLIPGAIGSSRSDFYAQLDSETGLDQDQFTIIAVDCPGYGYSRPPERQFGQDVYHRDAHAAAKLMEKLGYKRFSVVGWSDGAKVGLSLAINYRGRVDKLVIWGVFSYATERDVELVTIPRDLSIWDPKMRANYEKIYGTELFKTLWDRHMKYCDEIGKGTYKWDLRPMLPKIQCPTFVLHGDRDPMCVLDHPLTVVKSVPDSRLHRFPQGGHNIHQQYVKEFNELITDFLLE